MPKISAGGIVAVVWDFDGVILDSVRDIYLGVCGVFREGKGEIPTLSEFLRTYETPFPLYYQRHGVDFSWQKIQEVYDAAREVKGLRVFPEFLRMFDRLHEQGYWRYVLSAVPNSDYILGPLDRHHLVGNFHEIYYGHEDKVEMLKRITTDVGCSPKQLAFIGDMRSDMRDGKLAGVTTIGLDPLCFDTKEALRNAGADHFFNRHIDVLKFILGSHH